MTASANSQKELTGPDAPSAIRARIKKHKVEIDSAYIGMGKDLYLTFHRKLYEQWGHDTFTDYLENEVGISVTRGERVRRIWTRFVKQEAVKPNELDGLGYTNALALLPVLGREAPEGLPHRTTAQWINIAKKLSWRDLDLEVKKYTGTTQKQKENLVAGGAVLTTEESPEVPPPLSPTDNRRPWAFKFHPSQFKVVDAAVAEIKRCSPKEMSTEEAMAHVATECLSSRMSKEEAPTARVPFLLHNLEKVHGGKFVWIPDDTAAAFLSECMKARPDLFSPPVEEEPGDPS